MSYAIEDNIPNVDTHLLSDVSSLKQLYLISKLLGESLPLEFIMSKCLSEWELSGEATAVDMGNSFSLIKFLGSNKVLQGEPWFVRGQLYCLQRWKNNLIQ